jgi:hypothetical protein
MREAQLRAIRLSERERRADPSIGLRGGRKDQQNLIGLRLEIPLQVRNGFGEEQITPRIAAQVTVRRARLGEAVAKDQSLLTFSSVEMAQAQGKRGSGHSDRDAQFKHLHGRVEDSQRRGQAVVSVDTKKRNGLAISRTVGRPGVREATRSPCGYMTSSIRRWGRSTPMVCLIRRRTRDE